MASARVGSPMKSWLSRLETSSARVSRWRHAELHAGFNHPGPEAASFANGDVKGRKGRSAQARPWIATLLAGSLLDTRSERRVGRGRGDQAARW